MRFPLLLTSLLLALAPSACSDDGGSSSSGTGSTRSATCKKFQDAVCDFAADQCSTLQRADCDDTYQSLYCKSDAAAQKCIDALASGTCSSVDASACSFDAVADPAPAQAACGEYAAHICDLSKRCDSSTPADCEASIRQQVGCDSALGASPSIGECFEALDKAECPASSETFKLPAECNGALKKAQSVPPGSQWQTLGGAVAPGLFAR